MTSGWRLKQGTPGGQKSVAKKANQEGLEPGLGVTRLGAESWLLHPRQFTKLLQAPATAVGRCRQEQWTQPSSATSIALWKEQRLALGGQAQLTLAATNVLNEALAGPGLKG